MAYTFYDRELRPMFRRDRLEIYYTLLALQVLTLEMLIFWKVQLPHRTLQDQLYDYFQ